MNIVWIIAILLIGYICLYCLVDRICKCAEYCSGVKAYGVAFANMDREELEQLMKFRKDH